MKQDLGPLGSADFLTAKELKEELGHHFDHFIRDWYRGIKWMRLPILSGPISGAAITLGGVTGNTIGPDSGYAWSLRRLIVTGLASGATPDVVNLYLNDNFNQPPLWQFNGNNFGYTFGKLELVLIGGDTLALRNVGNLTATGNITLAGELIEVPTEMLGKLAS